MQDLMYDKVLKPDELVSKPDSELTQLRRFYELKIDAYSKYDVFAKARAWIVNHRTKTIFIVFAAVIVMIISLQVSAKTNNFLLSLPAIFSMLIFMFFAVVFRDKKIDIYNKNFKTLDLLLKVRQESCNKKSQSTTINKNVMSVYEALEELKESNLTNLLNKLNEKGAPLTDKTVRGYLKNELKGLIGTKKCSYNSHSRFQKNAKVYFIQKQLIGK